MDQRLARGLLQGIYGRYGIPELNKMLLGGGSFDVQLFIFVCSRIYIKIVVDSRA